MQTATLTNIDSASGLCIYKLSDNLMFNMNLYGKDQTEFEVYAREGFTKVRLNGVELAKSLGVKSHQEMLSDEGYTMKIDQKVLDNLSDDELVRLWQEFEFTGDDTAAVVSEINNR